MEYWWNSSRASEDVSVLLLYEQWIVDETMG
jgi:hypothetical protein